MRQHIPTAELREAFSPPSPLRLTRKRCSTASSDAAESGWGVKKRKDYLQWEEYFMAIAFLSAQRSKDPNSQV